MADGTLEELFDDLNFELEVQPPVTRAQLAAQTPAPKRSAPTVFDGKYAEQAMAALDQLAPASVMLTENDQWRR